MKRGKNACISLIDFSYIYRILGHGSYTSAFSHGVTIINLTTPSLIFTKPIHLGEGPVNFSHSVFHIWVFDAFTTSIFDSSKTVVSPYSYYPSLEYAIQASNFQLPLTIKWDSSFFHSSFLPYQHGNIGMSYHANDYFFYANNNSKILFTNNQLKLFK